jgi:hypothetical protein
MIQKMLSVSTQHVSAATAHWLNDQCLTNAESHDTHEMASIHAGSHGYGWFVYCHDDGTENYPADLVGLMKWAREKHECDYINLDNAGTEHDDLEKYEW